MTIQWFPGHMAAARKQIAAVLARCDAVIEVLDARLPEASRNPLLEALRNARQRPCLRVLNKADLADPAVTAAWLAHYARQPGVQAVDLSCKQPGAAARLLPLCRRLAPHRATPDKPLRLLVAGIPNVGKSTLINALVKRRLAAVGDEPAITRQTQTYDLGAGMTLTDTPGLMWPKIEHAADGYLLAAAHAIGRNAVDTEDVASFLADILRARYPGLLATRYGLAPTAQDGHDVLLAVAARRGCRRGAAPDLARAAALLLTDFRSGALGRISLETPATRATQLARPEPVDG